MTSARREEPNHRELCGSCRKLMVPRLAFRSGQPTASFCPFCGAEHKNFNEFSLTGCLVVVGVCFALAGGLVSCIAG